MNAQANNETMGEFRARRSAEGSAARWERLRWYGLIAVLVLAVAVLCGMSAFAAVWIDRAQRADVVVIEKRGFDCRPKPLGELLRDKIRQRK